MLLCPEQVCKREMSYIWCCDQKMLHPQHQPMLVEVGISSGGGLIMIFFLSVLCAHSHWEARSLSLHASARSLIISLSLRSRSRDLSVCHGSISGLIFSHKLGPIFLLNLVPLLQCVAYHGWVAAIILRIKTKKNQGLYSGFPRISRFCISFSTINISPACVSSELPQSPS